LQTDCKNRIIISRFIVINFIIFINLLLFMYGLRVFLSQKYQVFGKRAVYGGDAQTTGILFILPFVASVLGIGLGVAGPNILVNLVNALSYVFLFLAGAVLGYTAFFAPDATVDHGTIALSDTVTTAAAAAYMNIPEDEVISLIHSGYLQARRVNDQYRIHKEVLIGYFQTKQELARNVNA